MHVEDKKKDDGFVDSVLNKVKEDPEFKKRLLDEISKIEKSEDPGSFNKISHSNNDLKKVVNAN